MFENLNDSAEAKVFKSDKLNAVGIHIRWTLKSVGFGELVLVCRDGEWKADREMMDKETITKILKLAAPSMADIYLDLDK